MRIIILPDNNGHWSEISLDLRLVMKLARFGATVAPELPLVYKWSDEYRAHLIDENDLKQSLFTLFNIPQSIPWETKMSSEEKIPAIEAGFLSANGDKVRISATRLGSIRFTFNQPLSLAAKS